MKGDFGMKRVFWAVRNDRGEYVSHDGSCGPVPCLYFDRGVAEMDAERLGGMVDMVVMTPPDVEPQQATAAAPKKRAPVKWKDITSYSQSEKDRTPRTFQWCLPHYIRVTVTRHRDYDPDVWLLGVPGIINQKILCRGDNPNEAQRLAVDDVTAFFQSLVNALVES
jgi:hypothetical protein